MTDLNAILTDYIAAFDTAADAPEQLGASMTCSFEVYLTEPDTDGPEVRAHAEILPGGEIAEPYLEARQRHETATCDIEPGTGLHRALQDGFTDMWTGWDDVPDDAPGELLALHASDLRPGDLVWRIGAKVASVDDEGTDVAGQTMVVVRFEGTPGTERWAADRELTVLR